MYNGLRQQKVMRCVRISLRLWQDRPTLAGPTHQFIALIAGCGPIPKQRPEQQPHPITRMDGSALASYSCGLLLLLLSISSPDVQGMENHV
jgi:hypothetical protein